MLDLRAFSEGLCDLLPPLLAFSGDSRELPILLLPLLPDFFLELLRFLEKVISESSVWPSFSSSRNFFWKHTFFFSFGVSDSLPPLGYVVPFLGSESVPMRYLLSRASVVSLLCGYTLKRMSVMSLLV